MINHFLDECRYKMKILDLESKKREFDDQKIQYNDNSNKKK